MLSSRTTMLIILFDGKPARTNFVNAVRKGRCSSSWLRPVVVREVTTEPDPRLITINPSFCN